MCLFNSEHLKLKNPKMKKKGDIGLSLRAALPRYPVVESRIHRKYKSPKIIII